MADKILQVSANRINEAVKKVEGMPDEGIVGPQGPPGSTGATGPQGPPGATPNFTIGTVTTLPAGSNATVTLTGTFPNLVLNFGIPRGADGQGEPTPEAKKYLGIITWKSIDDITLADISSIESDSVVKPQTIYSHTAGTMGNKALVCAVPKSFGTITSVIDGAGVNITNTYSIKDKTFNGVTYSVASTLVASLYNNNVVNKFNIQ